MPTLGRVPGDVRCGPYGVCEQPRAPNQPSAPLQVQPNGLQATPADQQRIAATIEAVEGLNPTESRPSLTTLPPPFRQTPWVIPGELQQWGGGGGGLPGMVGVVPKYPNRLF